MSFEAGVVCRTGSVLLPSTTGSFSYTTKKVCPLKTPISMSGILRFVRTAPDWHVHNYAYISRVVAANGVCPVFHINFYFQRK